MTHIDRVKASTDKILADLDRFSMDVGDNTPFERRNIIVVSLSTMPDAPEANAKSVKRRRSRFAKTIMRAVGNAAVFRTRSDMSANELTEHLSLIYRSLGPTAEHLTGRNALADWVSKAVQRGDDYWIYEGGNGYYILAMSKE